MAVDRYKHFRWTPRTAWITVAYVCIVPAMFGYIGYTTDVSRKHMFSNVIEPKGGLLSVYGVCAATEGKFGIAALFRAR